jgi:hypothetical protein
VSKRAKTTTERLTGPADTADPTERVSSTRRNPTAKELREGTVSAVTTRPRAEPAPRDGGNDRIETYTTRRPDGTEVTVTHNIDTGETIVED